jgi:hypothetical protein
MIIINRRKSASEIATYQIIKWSQIINYYFLNCGRQQFNCEEKYIEEKIIIDSYE